MSGETAFVFSFTLPVGQYESMTDEEVRDLLDQSSPLTCPPARYLLEVDREAAPAIIEALDYDFNSSRRETPVIHPKPLRPRIRRPDERAFAHSGYPMALRPPHGVTLFGFKLASSLPRGEAIAIRAQLDRLTDQTTQFLRMRANEFTKYLAADPPSDTNAEKAMGVLAAERDVIAGIDTDVVAFGKPARPEENGREDHKSGEMTGDDAKKPSVMKMPPAAKKVWDQYQKALDSMGVADAIDDDVYAHLEKTFAAESQRSGNTMKQLGLLRLDTWKRNLRLARSALGVQKNKSRLGRADDAGSIISTVDQ